nr:FAD binding domain-containing protein [Clostridium nigeriense]
MFTMREYVLAESLEQAYGLLTKGKSNCILGGLLWMKMGNKAIGTGIDLSNLGLNKIEENEEEFKIGCMTTLRDIEINKSLNKYFNNILKESVENIVGVQFRNSATIGGSIYSRFGFSDILTALLALDTKVEMYNGGIISLEDFCNMPYEKDILVNIIIKKNNCKAAYLTHRKSKTDFPVLAVAVSKCENEWKIAVGGRPIKAELAYKAQSTLSNNPTNEEIQKALDLVVKELVYGTNMRGTKEYREILAKVLVKRCIEKIIGGTSYAN